MSSARHVPLPPSRRLLPLQLWPVHPLWEAEVRLHCAHLTDPAVVRAHPELKQSHLLVGEHPFRKAEMAGVVTFLKKKEYVVTFQVDDGTGLPAQVCMPTTAFEGEPAVTHTPTVGDAVVVSGVLGWGYPALRTGGLQRQLRAYRIHTLPSQSALYTHWLGTAVLWRGTYTTPWQSWLPRWALELCGEVGVGAPAAPAAPPHAHEVVEYEDGPLHVHAWAVTAASELASFGLSKGRFVGRDAATAALQQRAGGRDEAAVAAAVAVPPSVPNAPPPSVFTFVPLLCLRLLCVVLPLCHPYRRSEVAEEELQRAADDAAMVGRIRADAEGQRDGQDAEVEGGRVSDGEDEDMVGGQGGGGEAAHAAAGLPTGLHLAGVDGDAGSDDGVDDVEDDDKDTVVDARGRGQPNPGSGEHDGGASYDMEAEGMDVAAMGGGDFDYGEVEEEEGGGSTGACTVSRAPAYPPVPRVQWHVKRSKRKRGLLVKGSETDAVAVDAAVTHALLHGQWVFSGVAASSAPGLAGTGGGAGDGALLCEGALAVQSAAGPAPPHAMDVEQGGGVAAPALPPREQDDDAMGGHGATPTLQPASDLLPTPSPAFLLPTLFSAAHVLDALAVVDPVLLHQLKEAAASPASVVSGPAAKGASDTQGGGGPRSPVFLLWRAVDAALDSLTADGLLFRLPPTFPMKADTDAAPWYRDFYKEQEAREDAFKASNLPPPSPSERDTLDLYCVVSVKHVVIPALLRATRAALQQKQAEQEAKKRRRKDARTAHTETRGAAAELEEGGLSGAAPSGSPRTLLRSDIVHHLILTAGELQTLRSKAVQEGLSGMEGAGQLARLRVEGGVDGFGRADDVLYMVVLSL